MNLNMTTIRQFLERKLYQNRYIFINYWVILHFILFFIIGIYFPNRWKLVIIGMIAFELFENLASGKVKFFKESTKDTITDFLFNILGYWIGSNFMGGL